MKKIDEYDESNLECPGCEKKFECRTINRVYMSCLLKEIKFEYKDDSEGIKEIWNYEELLKHLQESDIS